MSPRVGISSVRKELARPAPPPPSPPRAQSRTRGGGASPPQPPRSQRTPAPALPLPPQVPGDTLPGGRRTSADCHFVVQCGEQTHVMAADTAAAAQRWVKALEAAWAYCHSHANGRSITLERSADRTAHG